MKRRSISAITLTVLLISALLLTALPISAAQPTVSKWDGTYPTANLTATFSGGAGTKEDPYLLSSAADLAQMAANVNAFNADGDYVGTNYNGVFFKLTIDIDLDNKLWTPIGGGNASTSDSLNFFSGHFDGNFHTVSNLLVKPEAKKDSHVGFFGYILKKSGTPGVANFGIESGSVTGTARVGGLIGRAKGTMTIDNCYNKANVFVDSNANPLTGWTSAAGFVGQADGVISFLDCYNAGNLTGTYISANTASIGGFVGYATTGSGPSFEGCWNLGKVEIVAMSEGASAVVGGFSGYLKVSSKVSNCYSVGEVKTSIYNGGYVAMLLGRQGSTATVVDNCHITASLNVADLSADRFIGGKNASTFTAASGTNTVISGDAAKPSFPHPDYNFLYIPDSMLGNIPEEITPDGTTPSDFTDKMNVKYYQLSTAAYEVGEGDSAYQAYSLRLIALHGAIDTYEDYGYDISITYIDPTTEQSVTVSASTARLTTVATSIAVTETDKETLGSSTRQVTAAELDESYTYLSAVCIDNIPVSYGEITVTVTPNLTLNGADAPVSGAPVSLVVAPNYAG